MLAGGDKKVSRTMKTKFKKNRDNEFKNPIKTNKHRDKSLYRLIKEEENEFAT